MAAAIGLVLRLIAGGLAGWLAYWSFRSNAEFWRVTFAANLEAQAFYVSLSYAAGSLKYGLAVYAEFFRFRLRDQKPMLALFAVALVFDLLSGIGYARLSRSEIGGEAQQIAERRVSLQAKIAVAKSDVDKIPAGRVAARVRAEHDAQSKLGPCDARRDANTDRCRRLADLSGELADADAREKAAAKLDALRDELESLPAPREADPQAAALADAVNAVLVMVPGAPALSTDAAKWGLALLVVLLIEFGPVTCARAAVAHRELPPAPPAPVPRPVPKIIPAPQPANSQSGPGGLLWQPCEPKPPAPRRPARPGFDLLDVIRQADAGGPCPAWLRRSADGWLYLSQADAAAAAGVSKPTIGRRLKALEADGVILLAVTNTGTGVKLARVATKAA